MIIVSRVIFQDGEADFAGDCAWVDLDALVVGCLVRLQGGLPSAPFVAQVAGERLEPSVHDTLDIR